jgi:hypothetical protein
MTGNGLKEDEMAIILWDSLMTSLSDEFSSKTDNIDSSIIKLLKTWATVFETICTTPKAQLGLLNKVQIFCHDDPRFMKHFSVIVQQLYKNDVVSEAAILYWFEKVLSCLIVGRGIARQDYIDSANYCICKMVA